MILKVKCIQCGTEFSKEFDDAKIERLKNGELVQDVFPELTPDERELYFITHICGNCWDEMFGVEEDEDIETDYPDNYIQDLIELSAEEFADSK